MEEQSPQPSVPAGPGLGFGAGLLAAFVGLLPWLVTGGTAPLQNLWAASTLPGDMPFVLLPFSQYYVTNIIGLLVLGSVLAGIAGRWLRRRTRGAAPVVTLVTAVILVQLVALGQTWLEINAGLGSGTASMIYLATMVGVTALAITTGLFALLLVALAPRAGAVVGLAVGAMALGPWLTSPWTGIGEPLEGVGLLLVTAARWLPPVLVGLAIAWGGLRTVGRVVAALLSLGLAWIVPALTTAIQASLGSRAMLRDLPGVVAYFGRILVSSATMPAVVLPPLALCVVVAGVGLLVHRWRRVG